MCKCIATTTTNVVRTIPTFGLSGRLAALVWAISLTCLGGLVYGLGSLDGFDSNLLAEVVGVGLGIPIALILLNRLDEAQRRTQWAAVSAQVSRSIATIAHEASFEIWQCLPRQARELARNPVLIPDGGLAEIIDSLTSACAHAATLPTQSDAASQAYHAIEPILGYLSGVLAPRVAIAGVDLDLLARLADVEEAGRQWAYAKRLATNGALPPEQVWSNTADLARALAELARHVNLFPAGPLQLRD
jgi:hypothetical protein